MKKSEIWQVRLPFRSGHVQAGGRPALIVQDDPYIASLPTVLVVPFTGSRGALRFDGTILVQPDRNNGLTVPSVALVFQLVPVDRRDFQSRLGLVDAATYDQIVAVLDRLMGR